MHSVGVGTDIVTAAFRKSSKCTKILTYLIKRQHRSSSIEVRVGYTEQFTDIRFHWYWQPELSWIILYVCTVCLCVCVRMFVRFITRERLRRSIPNCQGSSPGMVLGAQQFGVNGSWVEGHKIIGFRFSLHRPARFWRYWTALAYSIGQH